MCNGHGPSLLIVTRRKEKLKEAPWLNAILQAPNAAHTKALAHNTFCQALLMTAEQGDPEGAGIYAKEESY